MFVCRCHNSALRRTQRRFFGGKFLNLVKLKRFSANSLQHYLLNLLLQWRNWRLRRTRTAKAKATTSNREASRQSIIIIIIRNLFFHATLQKINYCLVQITRTKKQLHTYENKVNKQQIGSRRRGRRRTNNNKHRGALRQSTKLNQTNVSIQLCRNLYRAKYILYIQNIYNSEHDYAEVLGVRKHIFEYIF